MMSRRVCRGGKGGLPMRLSIRVLEIGGMIAGTCRRRRCPPRIGRQLGPAGLEHFSRIEKCRRVEGVLYPVHQGEFPWV